MFEHKTLNCRDCQKDFIFTAGEQEFFATKALSNTPKRCPNCRLMSRVHRSGKAADTVSQVTCADCNAVTLVPFRPKGTKPVYCNACMKAKQLDEAKQLASI